LNAERGPEGPLFHVTAGLVALTETALHFTSGSVAWESALGVMGLEAKNGARREPGRTRSPQPNSRRSITALGMPWKSGALAPR